MPRARRAMSVVSPPTPGPEAAVPSSDISIEVTDPEDSGEHGWRAAHGHSAGAGKESVYVGANSA